MHAVFPRLVVRGQQCTVGGEVRENGRGKDLDLGMLVLVQAQQLFKATVLGQNDLLLLCLTRSIIEG